MIETWEQLQFGGNAVRFHSETVGNQSHYWECTLDTDQCDACHNYAIRKERS